MSGNINSSCHNVSLFSRFTGYIYMYDSERICHPVWKLGGKSVCVFDDREKDGEKSMCLATSTAHATTSVYSQDSQGTYICMIPKEYTIQYGNWEERACVCLTIGRKMEKRVCVWQHQQLMPQRQFVHKIHRSHIYV